MSESSTRAQRAKQWEAGTFFVEWMDSIVGYCKTAQGQRDFEKWIADLEGPKVSLKIIQESRKRVPTSTLRASPDVLKTQHDKDWFRWTSAAAFYGITYQTAQYWHDFAVSNGLFRPLATKPAPKRRFGETSGQWLIRRREMARIFRPTLFPRQLPPQCFNYHKQPLFDFKVARRIASSESDKMFDTLERLHTDPEFFISEVRKQESIDIVMPRVLAAFITFTAERREKFRTKSAFGTMINLYSFTHLAWKDASLLLDELASKGIDTPAAARRAYQTNHTLLWRFISVKNSAHALQRRLCGQMQSLLATCEYYKPFFTASTDFDLRSRRVVENEAYCKKLKDENRYSDLDDVVSSFVTSQAPSAQGLIVDLDCCQSLDDEEVRNKLNADVLDSIGDLAAATEFLLQLSDTEFAKTLTKDANKILASADDTELKLMRSIVAHMDPAKVVSGPAEFWDEVGEASRLIRDMDTTWRVRLTEVDLGSPVSRLLGQPAPLVTAADLDKMWLELDNVLWDVARALDRPNEPGRVARAHGLWCPVDPDRPQARLALLTKFEPIVNLAPPPKAPKAPAETYVQTIPVSGPHDSIVKSGHAYAAENSQGISSKAKTRSPATNLGECAVEEDKESQEQLLDFMPNVFRLGKNHRKLFHRILEPAEEERSAAPRKGQVRWEDFEKAMKRIGFIVEQTAGSSVRFNPPAVTAHPITFHRPHPDPVLTPRAIKWIGARLQRRYGWTQETFQRLETE